MALFAPVEGVVQLSTSERTGREVRIEVGPTWEPSRGATSARRRSPVAAAAPSTSMLANPKIRQPVAEPARTDVTGMQLDGTFVSVRINGLDCRGPA
jgi:hypothetical protein